MRRLAFKHLAPYQIQPNRSNPIPSTHVFVDTETHRVIMPDSLDEAEVFRLGCAIHVRVERGRATRRSVIRFNRTGIFWVWLQQYLSSRRPVWLWAHNVGFDLTQLRFWELLDSHKYRLLRACIEDPPTTLKCRQGRSVLWCVDTLNWFRCSLAELGDSLGLPKLPMPARSDPDEAWYAYCMRDTEIVERAVLSICEWVREHQLGCLRPTSPSQAMQAYRHRFGVRYPVRKTEPTRDGGTLTRTVERVYPVLHGDAACTEMERRAYYGGQCECYHIGRVTGPIYHLDTTSLYPYVMRYSLSPCQLLEVMTDVPAATVIMAAQEKIAIADITVTATHPLPVRCDDGLVRYCVGKMQTTLADAELRRAIDYERVEHVHRLQVYKPYPLFRDYVDYFWALRMHYRRLPNPAMEQLAKLMLNSLYGKFGQLAFRWRERGDISPIQRWGQWVQRDPLFDGYVNCRAIGGLVQTEGKGGNARHAFPAICACVTAAAREHMRGLRLTAGEHNCYYQDTDSLHVNQEGYDRLTKYCKIQPDEIGKLRLVEVADYATYYGLRDYNFGGHVVAAGVPVRGTQVEEGVWTAERFDGLASILSEPPGNAIIVRDCIIELDRQYRHGIVERDGRVRPYRMPVTFTGSTR